MERGKYITMPEWEMIKSDKKMMSRLFKLYGLIDPRNDELYYIGCTGSPMATRMSQHIALCDGSDEKNKRIEELLNANIFPKVHVFYYFVSKEKARIAEKYITHFLANNKLKVNLSNKNGVINCSENINMLR